MTAESYFDGEENRAVVRSLDRDSRAVVAALFCAVVLGAAVSGAGHGGSPAPGGAAPAPSQAQAVLGQAAALPSPASGPVHAASGGS